MSKTIKLVLFVILAGAVIFFGREYGQNADQQVAEDTKANQEQQLQAALLQQQADKKDMEKLKIEDVVVGTGAEAKAGNTLTVHYVGTLDNGKEFDSSYKRNEPVEFPIGIGQLIKGWDLGIPGMKVGGKRKLTIPSELGYGADGMPQAGIPANATLHFTVELLGVK